MHAWTDKWWLLALIQLSINVLQWVTYFRPNVFCQISFKFTVIHGKLTHWIHIHFDFSSFFLNVNTSQETFKSKYLTLVALLKPFFRSELLRARKNTDRLEILWTSHTPQSSQKRGELIDKFLSATRKKRNEMWCRHTRRNSQNLFQ